MPYLMLLLLLLGALIGAQEPVPSSSTPQEATPAAAPEVVHVGMMVTRIDDLDMVDGSFVTTFWAWAKGRIQPLTWEADFELPEAREVAFSNAMDRQKDDLRSHIIKCQATIAKEWELDDFPFDRQRLRIRIESTDRTADALRLEPDLANTNVHPSIRAAGYYPVGITAVTGISRYDSNFGELDAASDALSYSYVDFVVELAHDGHKIFFKLFIATYAAFIVSFLTVLLAPDRLDAKLALVLTSFFAVIGNQYILDSMVHSQGGFNLIDKVQAATFLYAVITSAACVLSARFAGTAGEAAYIVRERWFMVGLSALYIAFNVVVVMQTGS